MMSLGSLVALALFSMELGHALTHTVVMLGLRLLPREQLVARHRYFIFDTLTVVSSCVLLGGQWWLLALLQHLEHLYFIFRWDQSWIAKEVITWSSLSWTRGRFEPWVLVLGTGFDIVAHATYAVLLARAYLTPGAVLLGAAVTLAIVYQVMFSPASPWKVPPPRGTSPIATSAAPVVSK